MFCLNIISILSSVHIQGRDLVVDNFLGVQTVNQVKANLDCITPFTSSTISRSWVKAAIRPNLSFSIGTWIWHKAFDINADKRSVWWDLANQTGKSPNPRPLHHSHFSNWTTMGTMDRAGIFSHPYFTSWKMPALSFTWLCKMRLDWIKWSFSYSLLFAVISPK